ncbi:MAG: response regulator [Sulfuricella denitrificans]|nr:response regulator [Sulfuricella denitrificans]
MSNDTEQATVFVVDDDEAMRDSLCLLLESVNLNARVFSCAQSFLGAFERHQSGCLLLDVRMPDMSGMTLLDALRSGGIVLPVIMITGHGDVPMAVRAMKQGAFDFIQKPFNARELLDRVHAALEQDRKNRLQRNKTEQCRALFMTLTDREMEVVDLVVAGNPSKIIARTLGISPKTVDIHRANIMRKLDVRTVAEMVQLRLSLRDA